MTLTIPFVNLALSLPISIGLVLFGIFIYLGLSTFIKYLLQAFAICLVILGIIGLVFLVI